ncbi:MAG: DUF222 domain-containing protein, partial [Candidatus Dormibacteria bacterium]
VRQALDVAERDASDADQARRKVVTWWRDDGMFELMAVLPREEGALVKAALEAASAEVMGKLRASDRSARPPAATSDGLPLIEQIRADGFVRMCGDWVAARAQKPVLAPTTQVVVHVDAHELHQPGAGGRSHIEDGPWLSPSQLRFLGCDADVVTITERDGLPIDVGRVRRLISTRQRLALHARDNGCTFPGCSVPAKRCQGHHIRHWMRDGGPTKLENVTLLCGFHHGRHHDGEFMITKRADGTLRFETADGIELQQLAAAPAQDDVAELDDDITPRALDGGEPVDYDHAIEVLTEGSLFKRNATRQRAP